MVLQYKCGLGRTFGIFARFILGPERNPKYCVSMVHVLWCWSVTRSRGGLVMMFVSVATCDVCEATFDLDSDPDSFDCESSQSETCSEQNPYCLTSFNVVDRTLTVSKE